jgi:ketopantoate reductase
MGSDQTIGIAGAGSIGCFTGGMLAAGGRRVALLARPRVIAEIEANGLRPTSFEGFDQMPSSSACKTASATQPSCATACRGGAYLAAWCRST